MKKRNIHRIALLAALLSALSLSACGGGQTSKPSLNSQTGSTATSSPALSSEDKYKPDPDTKYKISIVANFFGPVDEDGFMLKKWEEQFNVDFDMWYIESAKFDEIFNLKLASNEIPDVMNTRTINSFNKYYEQQVLAEIPTELIDGYMSGLKEKLETESPGVFKLGMIDGKQYGIPCELRLHNKYRSPTIFRGDWLKKIGVTKTPETIAEFEDIFYKFTKEDPDGNGKNDTYGLSASGFPSVFGSFGYVPDLLGGSFNWADKDGKLVYTSIQPEMKEALKLLQKWYQDGVINPEFITGENKGGYWAISNDFIEGKIGYTGHGAYYHWCSPTIFAAGQDYVEMEKLSPQAVQELLFVQPPVGVNGSQKTTAANIFTGNMVAFGAHMADDPQKMAKILEIQEYIAGSTPERYMEFYYGEEGKMWEYDGDKVPQPLDIYKDPKEMAKVGSHYGLVMFSTLEGHSIINKKSSEWAEEKGFDLNGQVNKLMVTLPSQSTYLTELKKMENEMAIDIITGAKPIDSFDQFVSNWRAAGGEILEKEANDWYATTK